MTRSVAMIYGRRCGWTREKTLSPTMITGCTRGPSGRAVSALPPYDHDRDAGRWRKRGSDIIRFVRRYQRELVEMPQRPEDVELLAIGDPGDGDFREIAPPLDPAQIAVLLAVVGVGLAAAL